MMESLSQVQWTIQKEDFLDTWLKEFLIDRQAQGLSPNTFRFYQIKLGDFLYFCESQAVKNISQITPQFIRNYLLYQEEKGHNKGGLHCYYRSLKTFLRWYWDEVEPEGINPISKVKAPKLELEPIEGVEIDVFQTLLKVCKSKRDYAILCFMFDTGCRASEVINLKLEDVNLINGSVLIRKSKSKKPRIVYLGKKSRQALRRYISDRKTGEYLFLSKTGDQLTYWGLKGIILRLAKIAGIETPSLHDFRRGFALQMLRKGVDVFSLQNLMGHSDLQVLKRYLKQNDQDLYKAHAKGSPVDSNI